MGEVDPDGENGPRWISRDDFVAETVAAGYSRKEVRDALAWIVEGRGFASGCPGTDLSGASFVHPVRVRGQRAWNDAPLVDASELWPLLTAELGEAPAAKAAKGLTKRQSGADTWCYLWLSGLMRASPAGADRPKDALRAEAQEKWRGLSARAFNAAWNKAKAETKALGWSAPGRKPRQL